MSISYLAEEVKRPKLPYRIISIWLKQVVVKFGYITGDLSYIFCSDEYLKDINLQYLKHDYYTDIVTFDYCEQGIISGDMFISIDRVVENSQLFNCEPDLEFLRVIVHGLLHLLGNKDSSDYEKGAMRRIENECLFMFKEIKDGCIK
jgi:probable rRNA maturation factor